MDAIGVISFHYRLLRRR